MTKRFERTKEFLDGPNYESKLVMGWRYLSWVGHGGWFSKICIMVWICIVLAFSVLPWYILVGLLKIGISDWFFIVLGIIGIFIGFYIAIMLSYYFYITGWQE